MRSLLALVSLAGAVTSALAAAPTPESAIPAPKSITALAFGPNGVLFIGDSQAATIYALETGDKKASGKDDVTIEKLGDKLGSALGTAAANVTVADVKVNPASGNIYLAVTRGKGKDAQPALVKVDRTGKLSLVDWKGTITKVTLPNASEKQRQESITSMAFVDGKLIVAGLSNEEFASTLRAVPYPFQDADKGTSVEVFHGAHGKLETQAPVRTFVPYKLSGADFILAAYTCTPLVKVPVADLNPGQKVKGTTIAELGNRNRPLDMIVYAKGGKDYVLMANSARGVMKIPAEGISSAEPITTRPKTETAGTKYETIKELTGVLQLDRLDDDRALVLIEGADKGLTLKSIPMP